MSDRKWVVKVNGRKSLNGVRYGVTLDGAMSFDSSRDSIYDQAATLALAIEEHNREMEFPDSIQISLP